MQMNAAWHSELDPRIEKTMLVEKPMNKICTLDNSIKPVANY